MKCEIITVGTEILLGNIVNTNAQYLSEQLSLMGVQVFREVTVGDNPERLKKAFSDAFDGGCDLVITTGGLGPTGDDITKEVACEYLEIPLILDEQSLNDIKDFFKKTGRTCAFENEKQAYLPEGAQIFRNDIGTAPGFAASKDKRTIIVLPGPPREMKHMFENCAAPFIKSRSDSVIFSQEISLYGIGESSVDEMLKELMMGKNPTLAPYAKEGYVVLRITAKAENTDTAKELCKPVMSTINDKLSDYIISENGLTMEKVLYDKLLEKGKKISFAESCTGGLLSKLITGVPGASAVYEMGICSYSDRIKNEVLDVSFETLRKYGAVSSQTAAEMAEGIRLLSGADIGISVTGVAGPDKSEGKDVGLVFIGVSDKKGVHTVKRMFGHGKANEREYIRKLSALAAMNEALKLLK